MHVDLETLSAHLDGDLDASARATVSAHLADCAACRGWASDLEAMRALSANAELTPPSPDLWPAIAAGLRPGPVSLLRAAWLRGAWLRGPRVAWATAALMAALAVASWLRPPVDPYAPVRASYLAQIEALTPAAQASRARLPEASRRDVVASLELVDRAIADCERALLAAPADRFGQEALLALYDEKVRVLRASITADDLGGHL